MSWDLTFIYEQELRSKSMNDILRGVVKPGVFNPNMYLYTDTGAQEGVHLLIKKGTTLVFSNGRLITGSTHNRNLDVVGEYIIKAVANTDITTFLMSTASASALFETVGGVGAPNAPILFVAADFLYEPDNTAASSEIGFSVYRPNYPNTTIEETVDTLPNEDMLITDGSYRSQHSFLILGTILNVKNAANSYASGGVWTETGELNWKQDHVFTGRSLPDYSRNIARDFHEDLPDIGFAKDISKVFLTSGKINYEGNAYRVDGKSWRSLYGSGGVSYTNTNPGINLGFIIDYNYLTTMQAAWAANPLTLSANKLYLTVVYLALKGKFISATDANLSTLLNVATNDATMKLLPITVEMDMNAITTNVASSEMSDDLFGESGVIVPLDVSINNIKRLKALLDNKAVFHKIVDYMRRNSNIKPYLDPANGETLVPIFVGIRKTNVGDTNFDDPATLASAGINPVNTLTFKDLQAVPEAVLSNAITDVFNIVSILE